MTAHLETAAGFVSTFASAIFGSVTLPAVVWVADSMTGGDTPDWIKWLLGPLGALVGMVIAIKWLTARLDKAEVREQLRQNERDAQMMKLVELGIRSNMVIEQNNVLLAEVKNNYPKILTPNDHA